MNESASMPILNELVSIYAKRGIEIATGIPPHRYANLPQIAATWFVHSGESLTVGLGVSLQEIYFLECLFGKFEPRSCFIIGNSWGWSTFALALLNPSAKVVAIDSAVGPQFLEGLNFTNQVAHEHGLNVKAIQASSPEDVPRVMRHEFEGPVEFVFIDGQHTNDQLSRDFDAVLPFASHETVFLFHDVLDWGLLDGLKHASGTAAMPYHLLDGTTSGMGIIFDEAHRPNVADAIAPFIVSASVKRVLNDEVYRKTHRRSVRLRRSIAKRLPKALGAYLIPRR